MLPLLIESLIGNDIIDQEQSFPSCQKDTKLSDPVIQVIAWAVTWYYQNDVRIISKPLPFAVCLVVSQGGTNKNDEFEIIEVFPLK